MFATRPYQRLRAVLYAQEWALGRNPLFQNFAGCGGDCTNFISQCVFAGSCVMNGLPTFGWYYRSPGDYAPAWTGVPYFYNFITSNMENGPFGEEVPAERAELGDVVQLGDADGHYYHSLLITGARGGSFLVCAHNNDSLDRPLTSYDAARIRYIHIAGVRMTLAVQDCCFDGVFSGTSVFPTEAQAKAMSCVVPTPDANGIAEVLPADDGMPEPLSEEADTEEAIPVPEPLPEPENRPILL